MTFPEKIKPLDDLILPEAISSSRRICSILRPFLNRKNLLQLSESNNGVSTETTLLEIDAENNVLVAYRPEPAAKLDSLTNKDTKIRLSYKAVTIHFDSKILHRYHEEGITYYELEFPDKIEYEQRRANERYVPGKTNPIAIELYLYPDARQPSRGVIYDISVDGLRICFPGDTDAPLSHNSVNRCNINLPNGQLLKCQFRVSQTRLNETNNQLHIGGYFVNLDSNKRGMIERLITNLK
jgi:c-di-GMP-binding flagellar brake protein YcgR